jgi:hypothetical protein
MTDDRCIIVGAQGVSAIDRPTLETLTVEGGWELKQYSFLAGDPFGRDKRT